MKTLGIFIALALTSASFAVNPPLPPSLQPRFYPGPAPDQSKYNADGSSKDNPPCKDCPDHQPTVAAAWTSQRLQPTPADRSLVVARYASPSASLPELEAAKAAAAGAVATIPADPSPAPGPSPSPLPTPTPQPQPTPQPGATCLRCNGTGKIKPDGRVQIDCPDCGGRGTLTMADALRLVADSRAGYDKQIAELKQLNSQLAEQNRRMDDRGWVATDLTPITKALGAAPIPTPPSPTPVPITWLQSLEEGYRQSAATGKQAIIYWYGERETYQGKLTGRGADCVPCKEFQHKVLQSAKVSTILTDKFVCVAINASVWADTQPARLDLWKITRMPSITVVSPDWKRSKPIEFKSIDDVDGFVNALGDGQRWMESKTSGIINLRQLASARGATCNCVKTGVCTCGDNCRCPDCPKHRQPLIRSAVASEIPIEQGIDFQAIAPRNVPTPTTPAQYEGQVIVTYDGPSYGAPMYTGGSSGGQYSGGSSGGQPMMQPMYSAPPMYAAPSGGSSGGQFSYYQSAPPMQYAQPQYYSAPRAYAAPAYYNAAPAWGGGGGGFGFNIGAGFGFGGGGGGRRMICGPNGCFRY